MVVADGSLTIKAANAYVGDLAASKSIEVSAGTITLLTRPAGKVTNPVPSQGLLNDTGVDYVAGDAIVFSAGHIADDSAGLGNPKPTFANATAIVAGYTVPYGAAFKMSAFPNVVVDVNGQTTVIDVAANGTPDIDLASAIAGAVPRQQTQSPAPQEDNLSAALKQALDDMGIDAVEPLSPQLAAAAQSGYRLIVDAEVRKGEYQGSVTVTVDRLASGLIKSVLDDFTAIYGQTFNDRARTREQMFREFSRPWMDYAQKKQGAPYDARDFRQFIESHEEYRQAAIYLNGDPATSRPGLQGLFGKLKTLGLSDLELERSESALLRDVTPMNNMTAKQMRELILAGERPGGN